MYICMYTGITSCDNLKIISIKTNVATDTFCQKVYSTQI